ncbi:hypothetical protein C8Q76DRAFT_790639 [Earliella scabrosa]|nr:hypothetical protein C8Q76DRAFT_790639 [Earliella scabrosa]
MKRLRNIFDPKAHATGIDKFVRSYDFPRDTDMDDYLHVDLAPSFGTLNQQSVKEMDEELKVMIAGTVRLLESHRERNRNPMDWETINSLFMQNPLLEPVDAPVLRSEKLIKADKSFFKFNETPSRSVVEEVHSWFITFVGDEDVLRSTHINIDVMGKIVAQTGAAIDSFATLLYNKQLQEKTLIDIGILRFPDIKNPFFKVYRIQLTAWSESKRVATAVRLSNGITGVFNSRKFRPRKEVIKEMGPGVLQKAIDEAEALFD